MIIFGETASDNQREMDDFCLQFVFVVCVNSLHQKPTYRLISTGNIILAGQSCILNDKCII